MLVASLATRLASRLESRLALLFLSKEVSADDFRVAVEAAVRMGFWLGAGKIFLKIRVAWVESVTVAVIPQWVNSFLVGSTLLGRGKSSATKLPWGIRIQRPSMNSSSERPRDLKKILRTLL